MRIFLLRHAKSDWGDKSLDDHDRPLAARGIAAAPRIGAYMRAHGLLPSLVKCSSSKRTRETWDLVAPFVTPSPKVEFTRKLYLAERRALIDEIHQTPASCEALLLIGHNPGLGDLALWLAALPQDDEEDARRDRLEEKFSTAALAVLEFSAPGWRALRQAQGRLADFVRPKELENSQSGTKGRS